MNLSLIVWRTLLRSARNASMHDARIKVALSFLLVLNLGVGLWASNQLAVRLQQWQAQDSAAVQTGLWLICLFTWLGTGLFSLAGIQRALSSDEALLLFTLPIPHATRFRTLFGSFFIESLWSVTLLQLCVTSYVLVSSLGWRALYWLLLLQIGSILVVLCTLVTALLMIRYLLPHNRIKERAVVIIATCALLILLAFPGSGVLRNLQGLLLWLRPEPVIMLFTALLLVILGPLAGKMSELYSGAFSNLQGRDRSRGAFTLPGVRAVKSAFERHRSLTAALFVRTIASQSRNILFWLRLLVILFALVLFPVIHTALTRFSDTFLVPFYVAGLAVVQIIEPGSGAISGEGNRLSIYLTAPYKLEQILRAKLVVMLLPVLGEGLLIGLFLCWQSGLSLDQAIYAIIASSLVIVSCTAMLVLGSVWDEELDLPVEGMVQTLLQEETPLTPRRITLFSMTIVCFVALFLLLWKLPIEMALLALGVVTVGILVGMGNFSRHHLRSLLHRG